MTLYYTSNIDYWFFRWIFWWKNKRKLFALHIKIYLRLLKWGNTPSSWYMHGELSVCVSEYTFLCNSFKQSHYYLIRSNALHTQCDIYCFCCILFLQVYRRGSVPGFGVTFRNHRRQCFPGFSHFSCGGASNWNYILFLSWPNWQTPSHGNSQFYWRGRLFGCAIYSAE